MLKVNSLVGRLPLMHPVDLAMGLDSLQTKNTHTETQHNTPGREIAQYLGDAPKGDTGVCSYYIRIW